MVNDLSSLPVVLFGLMTPTVNHGSQQSLPDMFRAVGTANGFLNGSSADKLVNFTARITEGQSVLG
jgi:hypothetical protein